MSAAISGSVGTVIMFAVFIVIVGWAYSRRQKKPFQHAADLPFADEAKHQASVSASDYTEGRQ